MFTFRNWSNIEKKKNKYWTQRPAHPSRTRVYYQNVCVNADLAQQSTIYTYMDIEQSMHISEHTIYGDIQTCKNREKVLTTIKYPTIP